MATVEVAREEITRKLVDAINRRDANAVAALYAPDAVSYDPVSPEGLRGREAIRKLNESLFKAFQNVDLKRLNILAKGDIVATEWVATASHTGPLALPTGTIAPTNRSITLRGANFYRINREGLIAEEHGYFDLANFLQQLGVKPMG